MASISQIKQLREETGVSISECQKALDESRGNIEKAKEILRQWGKELANKRSGREARHGFIKSYIHPNEKIGVLLDIRCESDFVARSDEFKKLANELSLQIAAMNPLFLTEEEITEEFLDGERKIYQEQFRNSGKPQKIVDQIIEGKLKKYKEEIVLLSQPWVKDENKKISDLINEYISKIGENIIVKRFVRFEI